jgi:prepilin-type N-terminal cleavage/methylation domain-containing protein
MKKNGFSLIELIVVITIIAVLTAVGMVSFGGANRKSRDAKRVADLERYRVALEMARQIGGTYPATLDVLTQAPYNLMGDTLSDPKSGYTYKYHWISNYSYELYACVEDAGTSNTACSMGYCNCTGGACLGSVSSNYMIKNP